LDHATAFAKTTQWFGPYGTPEKCPNYYWSANNDVTFFGRNGILFRLTRANGVDTPPQQGPNYNGDDFLDSPLSPDGKWFVEWHLKSVFYRRPEFLSMDGKTQHKGSLTGGPEGVWLPGSPPLFASIGVPNNTLDLYHPDSDVVQKLPFSALPHFDGLLSVDSHGRLVGFEGTRSFARFVGPRSTPSPNYPFMRMARVDLTDPRKQPERWKIRVPESGEDGWALLSPQGDRVLWTVLSIKMLRWTSLVNHYLPGITRVSGIQCHWLVSGLHGENMREIAAYTDNPSDPYSAPRWMPDGRHISFIYQATLYTRPIE
jgi:hypothetical protein